MKRTLLVVLLFAVFSISAVGQFTPPPACAPNLSGTLVCTIPEVYGPTGLTLANPKHVAHFNSSFQSGFAPLTLAVGTEVSALPLASPASGVLFTFDRSLGIVTRSQESFGPILSERAETIGKHRLYLAGTYAFYDFSSLDGINLKHIPSVFSHVEFPFPAGDGIPGFEHDYITTQNRIDLKVHQVTFYGTFGLTNRLDVSVAVPILDVHEAVSSAAHIVRVQPEPVPPTDPTFALSVNGFFHYFNSADPAGAVDASFHNAKSAAGLGDVIFRVKGTFFKGERARAALGLDFRTPTGDETNFLGAGAVGVRPFLVFSYGARVSPHADVGFQYNGDSILAGNVQTGTTAKLPNQFFYAFGVDVGITKRLTGVVDLLGQRISSTVRVKEAPFVDEFGVAQPGVTQTILTKSSLNSDDLSLGVKYSPFGNFLITGNILVTLNNAGLRANVVPLVGVSYSF